jgi:CDP-glucose 4,6-dehydratase
MPLGKFGNKMAEKNYWFDRNVFVTGASGIIGSWLTKDLVENGANVTVLLRDFVPKSNLVLHGTIDKVNVVNGELENYHLLIRILNEYEIDTCFHLGAQAIVGTANRNPLSTFESNIKGSWVLFEAARNSNLLNCLVVASSDKAYGDNEKLPYTEDFPLQGRHPYAVSKSCTELLANTYFTTYGLPVCITRCGNIFGGGDLNFSRIVPGTIRSILFNEQPIIRSDGTLKRDYFYVIDAVHAYKTAAASIERRDIKGQAFNFSNEQPLDVLEIVEKITRLMKSSLKPKILNEAKHEIKDQYLDCTKARKLLGWKPKYSIEQGLKETIDWYKAFFKKK